MTATPKRGYWLIGEAPTDSTVRHPELWLIPDETYINTAANGLLRLAGWSVRTYTRVFTRRIMVWRQPRPLCMAQGRENAVRIAQEALCSAPIGLVLLGGRVATAFGLPDAEPFRWVSNLAVVPHPGNRCLYWNRPESAERARAFFDALLVRTGQPARRAARISSTAG